MDEEDILHSEIREWIIKNGFLPASLEELLVKNSEEHFMTESQKEEAEKLMYRFYKL